MTSKIWKKVACSFTELNLDITLAAGQSFRWTKTADGEWLGVILDKVCSLKQDDHGNLLYLVHSNPNCDTNGRPSKRQKKSRAVESAFEAESSVEDVLINYFNLNFPLKKHYQEWSKADCNFKSVAKDYQGIRILRQDPLENLFSFICSANNNIPRITSMVEKLCLNYGEKIVQISDCSFHKFPTIEKLAGDDVETTLRKLGFGYRAKYINQTARMLFNDKEGDWLYNLRKVPYKDAHAALTSLPGVGAKVADCVCLMSLDKYDAIPVDTHIWQVTVKDYMPHLKSAKTLTTKIYQEIGDFYRKRFGDYAGWANTVLFAADLKMFKEKKK